MEKDAKGYVLLTLNGKEYGVNVSNGEAILPIPCLSKGKYDLTVAYFGDEKYDWDYASCVLTVGVMVLKILKKFLMNLFLLRLKLFIR